MGDSCFAILTGENVMGRASHGIYDHIYLLFDVYIYIFGTSLNKTALTYAFTKGSSIFKGCLCCLSIMRDETIYHWIQEWLFEPEYGQNSEIKTYVACSFEHKDILNILLSWCYGVYYNGFPCSCKWRYINVGTFNPFEHYFLLLCTSLQ